MEEPQSAVIAGATGTLRTLVDGTVRLFIDFEPKDGKAVMGMFGAPGTPIAVARLRDGYGAAEGPPPAPTPAPAKSAYRDLGPICREAIDLCGNPLFQEYIARPGVGPKWKPTADAAKGYILSMCNVDSRKDLDGVTGARELFIEHVRKPFHRWLEQRAESA